MTRATREALSRERILKAALQLIERDGADALTMRKLGDELGVEAMSLYNHLPNREAVLDGIGEFLMTQIAAPASPDWETACREFAQQLHRVTVTHPNAFRLLGMRPLDSPATLRPVERLLQVLVDAGAEPDTALAIYRAIASYARGYALAEVSGFTVDASTTQALRRLRDLDPGEFPILSTQGPALRRLRPSDGFAIGLDALINGIPLGETRPPAGR